MKICIVGGTGNISTSISKLLLKQGHDVTLFNRGQNEAIEGARVLIGDRSHRDTFEAQMQAEKFDTAIDMICFDAEDARSSVRAFRGVSHFVQCSTVCTYGVAYDWMPVSEDHPLRPTTDYGRNKVAADNVFLEEYYARDFPVTIIKPSTTFGPRMGLLRQVAWDFSWIDRVRKCKPILVCGDGYETHQFLYAEDAALAFAGVLGKSHCIGQTYNMTNRGYMSWRDYHETAMKVIGREVELVGVPFASLEKCEIPNFSVCADIFRFNSYFDSSKLFRHVPEFVPQISLETGIAQVLEVLDADGRIPDSDEMAWEDEIIKKQLSVFCS
ncbi:MAG: NAD-dependent epimerase/dehydratase family protein [Abditibacteriaceae bacterium]